MIGRGNEPDAHSDESDTAARPAVVVGIDRLARVRAIVDDCLQARAAGRAVRDDSLIESHPDLMPELGRELALLAMIERARSRAGSSTGSPLDQVRAGALAHASHTGSALPRVMQFPAGYEGVREIHRGGQGVVHEAVQRATGRRVAVKIQHESLTEGTGSVERFEREVEILAQLDHPNIVSVLDSGVFQGRPFYVMDFVEGRPLDEFLAGAEPPLSLRALLELFEQIVSAVAAAHVRGIIHRDLKPANILVTDTGEPRLVDFGLARLNRPSGDPLGTGNEQSRTIVGQFLGSVPWSSPEQAEGDPARIDVRSDVYSLGVVLFQMLTGTLPYKLPPVRGSGGESGLRAALNVIATAPPLRPSSLRKHLDADIDTMVLKCLSKEPARRYQSAAELAEDVRRHLESRPIVAHPPTFSYQFRRFVRRNRLVVAAGGAVVVALGIGAAATLSQLSRARGAEALARERATEADRRAYTANLFAADMAIKSGDGRAAQNRLKAAPATERGWEWGYLSRQTDQGEERFGMAEPTRFVRELRGLGGIVTCSNKGKLRCWDATNGTPRWDADLKAWALAMTVSGDGERIALRTGEGVTIISGSDGSVVARASQPVGSSKGGISLSPDGMHLAVADGDEIRIYQTSTGQEAKIWRTPNAVISGVEFTPDGHSVLCVEAPDLVVRSAEDLHEQGRMLVETGRYQGWFRIAVSPDGRHAAVSRVENICVFDLITRQRIADLRGHARSVSDLRFSSDGQSLVSCSEDSSVRVWDVASAACVRVLLGHTAPVLNLCLIGSTGNICSTSVEEPSPRIWRPRSGAPFWPVDSPARSEIAGLVDGGAVLALSRADGGLLALEQSLSGSSTRKLIDADRVVQIITSADGRLAVGLDQLGEVKVWDVHSARQVAAAQIDPDERLRAITNDARLLAVSCNLLPDDTVDNRRPERGRMGCIELSSGRRTDFTVPGGLASVVIIADQTGQLATVGRDRALRVWGLGVLPAPPTSRLLLESEPHAMVVGLAARPGARQMASSDTAGVVRLWDLDSGKELTNFRADSRAPIMGIAFTPDGRRLAAGGVDGAIRIFDARNGEELLLMRGHESYVRELQFSTDGRWLLSQSHDRRCLLWDGGPTGRDQQGVK